MIYVNHEKLKWRQWAWSEIYRRIGREKVGSAVGLYLPGPPDKGRDRDFQVAEQLGFNRENLIAVERDEDVVRKLRSTGINTLHANIEDAVLCWPLHTPLSFVFADLLGGYSSVARAMLMAIMVARNITNPCAIVFNLCSGHDESANELRAWLTGKCADFSAEIKQQPSSALSQMLAACRGVEQPVHRGAMLFLDFAFTGTDANQKSDATGRHLHRIINAAQPCIRSYKSQDSGNWYDSVAFNWWPVADSTPLDTAEYMYAASKLFRRPLRTRARISAALAHRTRRLAATEAA